jgi:hypothetical protein
MSLVDQFDVVVAAAVVVTLNHFKKIATSIYDSTHA